MVRLLTGSLVRCAQGRAAEDWGRRTAQRAEWQDQLRRARRRAVSAQGAVIGANNRRRETRYVNVIQIRPSHHRPHEFPVQCGVASVLFQQLNVVAALDDPARIEDQHLVRMPDGR